MTEPRRILIVSHEYPPFGGGGGVIFRDLAQELARTLDVTVLTSGRAGLAKREEHGRLEIVRTPVWLRDRDTTASFSSLLSFLPSSLQSGHRLLRARNYDLVHSSFAVPSGPSGLLLARRFGLPHVLSVHGGDLYDPSKRLSPHRTPLLKQTVRWVIRKSDRVVAQSSDTLGRVRGIYGRRDVDCIPLAVQPVAFEPRDRAELGVGSKDEVLLITIGRLIARKGVADLIDILAAQPDPRLRLVVVGEGPLRSDLEARARIRGVGDRVAFTGFVEEERKWQLLAVSDLYVSTTLHEGFGITFLEAMDAGVPVLCYDQGGHVDFVDEQVGALVPVGGRARFASELARIASDDDLRREMGSTARQRAREYHIDRMVERYVELYRECLRAPCENSRP